MEATARHTNNPLHILSNEQRPNDDQQSESSPTASTNPSDGGRQSDDGSCRSGSPARRERSDSSVSEPIADEPDDDNTEITGKDAQEKEEPSKRQIINRPRRGSSGAATATSKQSHDGVQRLNADEMRALMSSPESLPIAPAPPPRRSIDQEYAFRVSDQRDALRQSFFTQSDFRRNEQLSPNGVAVESRAPASGEQDRDRASRSTPGTRTVSTPPSTRTPFDVPRPSSSPPRRYSFQPMVRPSPLQLNVDGVDGSLAGISQSPVIRSATAVNTPGIPDPPKRSGSYVGPAPPSPIPAMIPLPPMSLPTHLQLELAAERPSPLYIHQSHANDMPYESSAIKFERLKNVLLLPPYLERTLHFGALACLDAWLYNFTILPIRFISALAMLARWWGYVVAKETRWLIGFVWDGSGRLWERGRSGRLRRPSYVTDRARSRSRSDLSEPSNDADVSAAGRPRRRNQRTDSTPTIRVHLKTGPQTPQTTKFGLGASRHRRTKSAPSNLSSFHKADLLQGALIICSSMALMILDASRMYHFIRAQSAIKLYVIYNILEVGDRLLSALGQDILECLFSNETLSRNAHGRSKVLLPLGMFILALAYNCLHSITLYYQVITLNVAVNSYSNALLTLLLSNQFVEIKSTVFKRIEKDNLFQLTCADIVERFHLWIMLLIIGMRNVVEVGGLSVPGAGTYEDSPSQGGLHTSSILPHSFTVLPSWIMSGEVLSPFLIVVGSEMLVDTIKHAYVTKFNNIKPNFYSRVLDVLCKDHYTNSFTTPSLTRRLGLAVIPLSCLFIRASVQTYHMFLSTHLPMPVPPSTQTSLSEESAAPSSPAIMAALNRFDSLIRDSLGRATYGYPYGSPLNSRPWYSWTSDDIIAALTMVVFFFITFLVLLILKLLLGMVLLQYSRNRYAKMKQKENLIALGHLDRDSYDANGKRRGGHGVVEIGEERQRWIHADRTEGLKGGKGMGGKRRADEDLTKAPDGDFVGVSRFEMVAKRIW